jgi:lipoate-protein ligase B
MVIFRQPISYPVAWELQSRLHRDRVLDRRPDTILILEHQPVYTLGRSTRIAHWGGDEDRLREHGAEVHCVNRGGSVTYHGPGQIVAYPILKLANHASGPKQLVQRLEEVVVRVLKNWRIAGVRIHGKPGVWVMQPEPAKIASIGIRIEQGVTLHGIALNVDMDLAPFRRIRPCGLDGSDVTSMGRLVSRPLSIGTIKEEMARAFADVLPIVWSLEMEQAYAGT